MEQYWMPKELDFENLRYCLDNYHAKNIFIRLKGSLGGHMKISENLEGKVLDFRRLKSGMNILIDGEKRFHFSMKDHDGPYIKGFSLAYERIDKDGHYIFLSLGEDPYDPKLPEPYSSILRTVWDDHLFEITFDGRVPLKFHSWWDKENGWKYWKIDKSAK